MQAFRLRPVDGEAEALLDRVHTQTAKATQCSALLFVMASLESQLNRLQDAHQTVAAIGQRLGDIPPPCWLLHFRTLLHWSKGNVVQVCHQRSGMLLVASACFVSLGGKTYIQENMALFRVRVVAN